MQKLFELEVTTRLGLRLRKSIWLLEDGRAPKYINNHEEAIKDGVPDPVPDTIDRIEYMDENGDWKIAREERLEYLVLEKE